MVPDLDVWLATALAAQVAVYLNGALTGVAAPQDRHDLNLQPDAIETLLGGSPVETGLDYFRRYGRSLADLQSGAQYALSVV